MSITDPIADMLTILRNANRARKDKADMPSSKLKIKILGILKTEGFIRDYKEVGESKEKTLRAYLKFYKGNKGAITDLKRVSRPGLRSYAKKDYISPLGVARGVSILSTSKGIMTDKQAKAQGVGGEVLFYIW